MAHCCSATIIQLFSFLLALCACLTTAYLEDKVSELEKNFVKMKEDFDTKVVRLETKVARLEARVERQESMIAALMKNEKNKKLASMNVSTTFAMDQKYKQDANLRTCQDVYASNPLLDSGMYWIDPDGQGVGDNAIHVFCNMTTGSTSVLHDSELKLDVEKCSAPGCYSRKINYYATKRQIAALSELSTNCSQLIKYDCNNAPLVSENVAYAWYNDKNGNKKDISKSWMANCKAVRAAQSIEGVFSNKEDLPFTRLNFGGTSKGSAQLTVGRFECYGKVNVVGMPASCEDLLKIGNTMSGLYSVIGNKKVQSVYCDFNKRPNEIGFQKWIGYADVKSMPVYFYVTMDASFTKAKTPLPFKNAKLNVGNAMDLSTGKFKAPRAGIYFFSFTGLAEFSGAMQLLTLDVSLVLNGDVIRRSYVNEFYTQDKQSSPLTLQTTISLKLDDQIWMQIETIYPISPSLVKLYSGSYTHFTGFLLEEEIVVSL